MGSCLNIQRLEPLITARCRDEIALRRARRRKSVGGCRAAEFWPSPQTVEKAHNGASPLYGAGGKVRRFAIMCLLIPRLIFDPGSQIGPCEINLQIKHALPNVIRWRSIFFPKRNAPSPFTSRLWRCRLTFTKQPTLPNRSVPSRLSKASTTSRFAATRKLAKERGV
jgi:hypothetical protein